MGARPGAWITYPSPHAERKTSIGNSPGGVTLKRTAAADGWAGGKSSSAPRAAQPPSPTTLMPPSPAPRSLLPLMPYLLARSETEPARGLRVGLPDRRRHPLTELFVEFAQ